jgi:hypothetical protein
MVKAGSHCFLVCTFHGQHVIYAQMEMSNNSLSKEGVQIKARVGNMGNSQGRELGIVGKA